MSTTITDEQLLLKCRKLIALKLSWPPSTEWGNNELNELHDRILEAGGVGLSSATLKRLFVDPEPPTLPDRSTLNAIANLLGYEGWEPLKKEHSLRASVLGALMANESDRAKLRSLKPFYLGVVIIALLVLGAFLFMRKAISQPASRVIPATNRINKEGFVRINGIEQWVTIKGDTTKPVILFLHGGPGSPLTPYAGAIYGEWEKDFTLVQWDQRGTARTYGFNAPQELTPAYLRSNPLTVEQMTADGVALTRYLLQTLGKQKVILFGTSWGSLLGVKMVQSSPELFYAYIGHSQLIHPAASNLAAYDKVVQLAQQSSDKTSLDLLTSIGKPPYDTAKHAGQLMRIVKKYQQKNTDPAPAEWFRMSAAYDNSKDELYRSDGDDYSFVHYTGDKRLGIAPMIATINFFEDALEFSVPVYFIQGEQDIQTPASINKMYFDKIKAPAKKLILLPKTEHGFNQSVVDAHLSLMKKHILPAIEK